MSDPVLPTKNEAVISLRKKLTRCPDCGESFDAVNVNSHKTNPNPDSLRFYFQFMHGEDECIVHVNARDFATWLEAQPS